jgi:hypothetical protein
MMGNTSRQSYQGVERRAKLRPFTRPIADLANTLAATTELAAEASMQPTAFLLVVFDLQGGLSVATCGIGAAHANSILEAMPFFLEDLRVIANSQQDDQDSADFEIPSKPRASEA